MTSYLRSPVDLEKVAQSHEEFAKEFRAAVRQNEEHLSTISTLSRQLQLAQQTLQAATDEKAVLQQLVGKWQGFVAKLCNLEEENKRLKQQLEDERSSASVISEAHAQQREELLCELSEIRSAHHIDIERHQQQNLQQGRRDKVLLEKQIEEKASEIRRLQKNLTNVEREKHSELVKLRLEYDSKLLKLQKQLAKGQPAPSSAVGHDIFRKKLENCKAESNREMGQLRKRIGDLEQQLALAKVQASRARRQ